jgi:hypothetical protein
MAKPIWDVQAWGYTTNGQPRLLTMRVEEDTSGEACIAALAKVRDDFDLEPVDITRLHRIHPPPEKFTPGYTSKLKREWRILDESCRCVYNALTEAHAEKIMQGHADEGGGPFELHRRVVTPWDRVGRFHDKPEAASGQSPSRDEETS